jgi:tetratricopeptide (TPR) repeat protein
MNNQFYEEGLQKAKEKDYVSAIAFFTRAIDSQVNFADAYYQRGLAYYDSGKIHQAIFDYTEAIKINPTMAIVFYCRALAKLALNNFVGSLEDIETTIMMDFNYAPAYNLKGIIKRNLGDRQEAINSFRTAAKLYLQQKDEANCRRCLASIEKLQPTNKQENPRQTTTDKDYFTQLLQMAENGKTEEALANLNWALETDATDAKAYCYRGVIYCKQQKYREAIADFNYALQLNFEDAIVYRNRARARTFLGDHQGAIADFDYALKLQPNDHLLYMARGNAYHHIGNYDKAIADYSQALKIQPDNAKTYYYRGQSYTCLEEISSAIIDYQKAISIYCQTEDWQNHQMVLAQLKKIQSPITSITPNQTPYKTLRQKLLRMVGGHWGIAQRLIDDTKSSYPGMSEEWYLEKVIQDWENR